MIMRETSNPTAKTKLQLCTTNTRTYSLVWVSRQEAVDAGLFGSTVDSEVLPRIGDVLVAARSRVAYYDDRVTDTSPRRMIGQHGSLTDEESTVPLVRLGSFAR